MESEARSRKTLPTLSDRELVERIGGGDERALGELYERYAGVLLGLARRVLRRTEDSEEVVQEVLIYVWRETGRYDPARSSVSTWLVLLTRSRAIDRLRSRKVLQRALSGVADEEEETHTSPSGVGNVLQTERRRRLREALEDLPEEQRQVLELAYYGGLTQTEISARTGIPLGTVKTRTLLAMKKLRSALAGEIEELL